MNVALGITMLLCGHYILPDPDDNTPRLDIGLQSPNMEIDVQEEQLRYTTRRMRLPQAPSLGAPDDYQSRYGRAGANYNQRLTNNNSAYNRNRNDPNAIPLPPTDPNAAGNISNNNGSIRPNVSTPGMQNPNGYNNNNNQLANPNVGSLYNQRGISSNGVGNFAAPNVATTAGQYGVVPNLSQSQYRAPTASQYISQNSNGALGGANSVYGGGGAAGNTGYTAAGYGSGASSFGYGTGGDNRPFSGATPLAPVYSPYLGLYNTPTNNGTVSAFQSNVLPAIQQSQFNNSVNATIGGLPQTRPTRGLGPSGQDQQMGSGMANPNQFINYGNFNNTGSYYPQNP